MANSPVTHADLDYFRKVVGESYVLTEPEKLAPYAKDWTSLKGSPSACILPRTAAEVSKVLSHCSQRLIPVVPSGGRTGLAGGAVPLNGEVVISLSRMNSILEVDEAGLSITVEAGAITQEIQQVARTYGLFYAVDLAAKGSCQIGGNIATNAGGLKLIRYGGTREQVLGLEVVLADGKILDLNYNLVKNNTGYDLKHLFIGSEGTLGIVTKATLKLSQQPRELELTCLGVESFEHITQILTLVNKKGVKPTAFEFFTAAALKIVLTAKTSCRDPFKESYPFYVLIECEKEITKDGSNVLENLSEDIFAGGLAQDGVVATTSSEFRELWSLRELISESVAASGHVRKNDISLPISRLADFCARLELILQNTSSFVTMVLFGHIGDGNLHLNYVGDRSISFEEFSRLARTVEQEVFALCQAFRGSISAEHGIGLTKKNDLHFSRGPDEIALMMAIKRMLDPKNIMNAGKIFDS